MYLEGVINQETPLNQLGINILNHDIPITIKSPHVFRETCMLPAPGVGHHAPGHQHLKPPQWVPVGSGDYTWLKTFVGISRTSDLGEIDAFFGKN